VTAAHTTAGLLIAVADLALVIACWKRRSVLGEMLGAAGIPLAGYAITAGTRRGTSKDALLIAALALGIGCALYGLGQLLERLLDGPSEDSGN
jgi:hypothetical protein